MVGTSTCNYTHEIEITCLLHVCILGDVIYSSDTSTGIFVPPLGKYMLLCESQCMWCRMMITAHRGWKEVSHHSKIFHLC